VQGRPTLVVVGTTQGRRRGSERPISPATLFQMLESLPRGRAAPAARALTVEGVGTWSDRKPARRFGEGLRRAAEESTGSPCWIGIALGRETTRVDPATTDLAWRALQVGRVMSATPRTVLWEDVAVAAALLSDMQSCRALGRVLDPLTADRRNRDLVGTLATFYNQPSMSAAARALRVHRHTLENRLVRIEELTGLSVRHSPGRFQLETALMARTLVERVGSDEVIDLRSERTGRGG